MGIISGSIWGSFLGWGSFRGRDHFGGCTGPEMLVKYANFVKIQPIAQDKRVRPKASNLLVILIEPLSLK